MLKHSTSDRKSLSRMSESSCGQSQATRMKTRHKIPCIFCKPFSHSRKMVSHAVQYWSAEAWAKMATDNNAKTLEQFTSTVQKKMALVDQAHMEKLATIDSLHTAENELLKKQIAMLQAPRGCLKSTRVCEAANSVILIPND